MQHETIGGYLLEVGPHWPDYTPEQRAEICNGVGAANQPPWLAALLRVLPYLEPASVPHDIDYHAGGTSRDRRDSDRRFRRNCYAVARAEIGGFWSRLFSRPVRVQWAFAAFQIQSAYAALRLFGRAAFHYTAMEEPAMEKQA